VILQEGYLWEHEEVTIPMSAATAVDDYGISVSLTKQQVENLPPLG
jgi:hypothetical protein